MIIPPEAEQDAKEIEAGMYRLELPAPPASVLDIGANVGLFSVWARQQWPLAEIFAYEPDALNYADLVQNCNGLNIHKFDLAVAAHTGEIAFDAGQNRMCGRTGSGSRTVRCVAAQSLPSCEFVKIDVEGGEAQILANLDLSETKYVVVETHNCGLCVEVLRILTDQGFACVEERPVTDFAQVMKFVRHEYLAPREPLLFVALPIDNGAKWQFQECLTNLQMNPPCSLVVRKIFGDSLVSRARNNLALAFLRSAATHLLFIDSDLIFSTEHVKALMDADLPIVGGLYPKKQRELGWVLNVLPDHDNNHGRLFPVKCLGTGFLMIKREVFERMRLELDIAYDSDDGNQGTGYDFFPVGRAQEGERMRYMSEDWFFCHNARQLGYDVIADASVVLKHVGDIEYPLEDPRVQLTEGAA